MNDLGQRLKALGMLTDARVVAAFDTVDRAGYLAGDARAQSAENRSFVIPVGSSYTVASQPSAMAATLEAAQVRAGDCVLEIGAGTGFQAALLSHLTGPSGRVIATELNEELAELARQALRRSRVGNVEVRVSSPEDALRSSGGVDVIVASCTLAAAPIEFLQYANPGARFAGPFQFAPANQGLVRLTRHGAHYTGDLGLRSDYMPYIGPLGAPPHLPVEQGLSVSSLHPIRDALHLKRSRRAPRKVTPFPRTQLPGALLFAGANSASPIELRSSDPERFTPLFGPSRGGWWGVSDADGLALVTGSGPTDPASAHLEVRSFGSPTAGDLLWELLEEWIRQGAWNPDGARITLAPAGILPFPSGQRPWGSVSAARPELPSP